MPRAVQSAAGVVMETEGVIASPPSSHLTAAAVGHMTKLLPKGCSTHGEAVALPSCAGAM